MGMVRTVVYSRRLFAFRINLSRVERARLTVYSLAVSVFSSDETEWDFHHDIVSELCVSGRGRQYEKETQQRDTSESLVLHMPPSVLF
jgi:hypothetical protein